MPLLSERYRHSATAGNMYLADPSAFVWRYGLGNWDEGKPRMHMGSASELACNNALLHGLSDDDAAAFALDELNRLTGGEVCDEQEHVQGITRQFLAVLRPLGKPLTYQAPRPVHGGAWGLTREIICKTDFGYGDYYIDTKATLRCPSEPADEHKRQQALYARILERPCELLYATPKKSARYQLTEDDVEQGFRKMIAVFRRIEALDEICDDAEHATRFLPWSGDSFYWNDDSRLRAAQQWGI